MDPFSAAASGIAVVSLAIQLGDSVREIQRFLRNMSEAPEELKRLLGLLEQLELILENIGAQMAKQQRNIGELDTRTIASVEKAMKMCKDKLLILEDFVKRAKKASEANNKAMRAMGAFKLACKKKKDVEEFEGQLQQAINLLDLTMTINLNSVYARSTDMILNQLALLKSPACTIRNGPPELANALGQQLRTTLSGSLVSQRLSASMFRYNSPFGIFVIRQKNMYANFDGKREEEVATSSETSWIFTPSFLSRSMTFRSINTFGSIERSFRVWPVISRTHPVWDICRKGNIVEFQTLLSSRAVSPFSVDPYGWTLLHHVASNYQFEMCELLLGLGLTGEEEDHHGVLPIQEIRVDRLDANRLQPASQTLRLLASKLTTTEVPLSPVFISGTHSLTVLKFALDQWVTPHNVKTLRSALYFSLHSMWRSKSLKTNYFLISDSCNEWKTAISRLIILGVDIHAVSDLGRSNGRNLTLLDHILMLGYHVFESQLIVNEWLDILRRAGVDVAEYLRVEIEHHRSEKYSFEYYDQRKIHVEICIEGRQEVACDLWLVPESNALDVLHKFKYYGPWRYVDEVYRWPHNWPYYCPEWLVRTRLSDGTHGPNPEDVSAAKLAKERFERREHKKAMKLARIQGLLPKGPKIPGSWID